MVGAWNVARNDPTPAAHALLSLFGITDPTQQQEVGGLLVAEFMLRVIHALDKKPR
jgi:hypothetical protein